MAEVTKPKVPVREIAGFYGVNNARAIVALVGDYAIIIAAAILAEWSGNWFVRLIAVVVIAGRQVALTNLMHSASHYTLFRQRTLNNWMEWAFAYPILDAMEVYRGPHLEHHVEIAKKLPERFRYLHDELGLPRRGPFGRTWVVFVRGFLGYAGLTFSVGFLKALWKHPRFALKMGAYWCLVVGACLYFGVAWQLLLYWFVPLLWLYPVFSMWSEISDHFNARDDARNQVGVFHLIFLKGHELYHGLHHRFPRVPFYRLPAVYTYLSERGEEIEVSSGISDFVRTVYRGEVAAMSASDDLQAAGR